jgi:hypothetical protein
MTMYQVREHLDALERHERLEAKRQATIARVAQYDAKNFDKALKEIDR